MLIQKKTNKLSNKVLQYNLTTPVIYVYMHYTCITIDANPYLSIKGTVSMPINNETIHLFRRSKQRVGGATEGHVICASHSRKHLAITINVHVENKAQTSNSPCAAHIENTRATTLSHHVRHLHLLVKPHRGLTAPAH